MDPAQGQGGGQLNEIEARPGWRFGRAPLKLKKAWQNTCTKGEEMAEVKTLEEKLAEVLGLARAAQGATEKVEAMREDDGMRSTLAGMRGEAEETECDGAADVRRARRR